MFETSPRRSSASPWGGGFEPKYVTIRGKGKILNELKKRAKNAESIILATDPDREGEAIAYHVAHQLGFEDDRSRFERVTFREITRSAVARALEGPEPLDLRKVEAQQARRILDRLVGYQVSPFLWKPIRPGLSAGRVQTVALRLVCEREDDIQAFESVEYWSVTARLEKDEQPFEARLQKIDRKAFTLENEEQTRGSCGRGARSRLQSRRGQEEGTPKESGTALYHVYASAGSGQTASILGPPNDDKRPTFVRGGRGGTTGLCRSRHLHENRFHTGGLERCGGSPPMDSGGVRSCVRGFVAEAMGWKAAKGGSGRPRSDSPRPTPASIRMTCDPF